MYMYHAADQWPLGTEMSTHSGVIIEVSEREKFCDNFRISERRSFGQNFGFPYTFYTFSLLPQLKIERSQSA